MKENLRVNLDLTAIHVTVSGKFSIIYYKDGQRRLFNISISRLDDPCKHFFQSLTNLLTWWDWNSLSKLHKNSPYLAPDENAIGSTEFEAEPVNKNKNDEIAHRENETITKTSDTITLNELPSEKLKVKNRVNGNTCRS